jgi:hypothetical protein
MALALAQILILHPNQGLWSYLFALWQTPANVAFEAPGSAQNIQCLSWLGSGKTYQKYSCIRIAFEQYTSENHVP